MRQRNDPEFFHVLQQLRIGRISDEAYSYLDQLVIQSRDLDSIRAMHHKDSEFTELCYTNQSTMEINMESIQLQQTAPMTYVLANDLIVGPSRTVENATQEILRTALPNITRGLMRELPLLVRGNT